MHALGARTYALHFGRGTVGTGAVLRQRDVRIDRVAPAGAHLEVQVRAAHVPGRADGADAGTRGDLGADPDVDPRQVGVPGLGSVRMGDLDLVAVGPVRPGEGHGP